LRPLRSELLPFTELTYDGGGGLARSEWHHDHPASPFLDFSSADYRVFGVVSTLNDDVGLEELHQIEWRVLRKDYDKVDSLERGEDIGPLGLTSDRASRPLQAPHRSVAVDPDDERIRRRPRGNQEVDVSGVEQVENSVGESDAILSAGSPSLRFRPGGNFFYRSPGRQRLLATDG
jgi:hypothetical protein